MPYDRSQTSQRDYSANVMRDSREPYREDPERYAPQISYPTPGPSDMYSSTPSTFSQQPDYRYAPASSYSPGPSMTAHSYQAPGYPVTSRSVRTEQPLYYDDPPRPAETYRQPNQYSGPPPRDSRMVDPTRPRYMPPMESLEPPQGMHRGSSQAAMPTYLPQQDVHMQDYDDDFEPTRQNRNVNNYPAPSGRMPEEYDYRGPSNQGPYIQRNPREEDRYREKRRGPGR